MLESRRGRGGKDFKDLEHAIEARGPTYNNT